MIQAKYDGKSEHIPRGSLIELLADEYHDWELLRYRVRYHGKVYMVDMSEVYFEQSAEKGYT